MFSRKIGHSNKTHRPFSIAMLLLPEGTQNYRFMWLKQCHVHHPRLGMVSLYHKFSDAAEANVERESEPPKEPFPFILSLEKGRPVRLQETQKSLWTIDVFWDFRGL